MLDRRISLRRYQIQVAETVSDLDREHYTPRHIKWLRKELKQVPLGVRAGSVICPHCKHLEARWRSEPLADPAGAVEVRIRCSQCQLSTVLTIA
jgi:hypothetical protein